MVELLAAVGAAFFKMRAAGRRMGAVSSWGGGTWGFLRSLAREGPRTVPALARARPVARQRIQRIADELAAEGLVAFVANPRHKRSRLVRLTPKGETAFAALDARVLKAARTLCQGMDPGEVTAATALLAELGARLDAFRAPVKRPRR
jgi:DNA-binding MarR family transcriptional regulator